MVNCLIGFQEGASLRKRMLWTVSGKAIQDGDGTLNSLTTSVSRQVLQATAYLHEHNVAHRDLKPENILYKTHDADSPLVIADFGIAKHLETPDEECVDAAGSFGYAAPEVLQGKPHGMKVDCWSIGYVLLSPEASCEGSGQRQGRRLTCLCIELSRTHCFAGILLSGRMIEMNCCKR